MLSTLLAAAAAADPVPLERTQPVDFQAGQYAYGRQLRHGGLIAGGVGAALVGGTALWLTLDQEGYGALASAWVTLPVGSLCLAGGELAFLRGARLGAAATGTDTSTLRAARWSFWGGLGGQHLRTVGRPTCPHHTHRHRPELARRVLMGVMPREVGDN